MSGGTSSAGVAEQPSAGLDVDALRHPSEPSRFALGLFTVALVSAVALYLFLRVATSSELLRAVLLLVLLTGALWLGLQLWRVRLLADGVKVDAASLPELYAITEDVRRRLGVDKRVDVFVVDKVSRLLAGETRSVTMDNFFGVRVIVIESGVLGDVDKEADRRQLTFVLATYYGAFKARHSRWATVLTTLWDVVPPVRIGYLFVAPWFRATVYTGDRLAYACCADLNTSVQSVYRSLVGRELAPRLRSSGLVAQAVRVRHHALLRLAQLLRVTPHVSNRYLELLAFAQSRDSVAFEEFRALLDTPPQMLEDELSALRRRRPSRVLVPLSAALSVVTLTAAVAWGVAARDDPLPSPFPSDEPTPAVAPEVAALLSVVPAALDQACAPSAADASAGVVAQLVCTPTVGPDVVVYQSYKDLAALEQAFAAAVGPLSEGDCRTGVEGRGAWAAADTGGGGDAACYVTQDGTSELIWTDERLVVLTAAADAELTITGLSEWWVGFARPAPPPSPGPGSSPVPERSVEPSPLPPPGDRDALVATVTRVFENYFGAINEDDYRRAWMQLSASMRSESLASFAEGVDTSFDERVVVHEVEPQTDGSVVAHVTFTSTQAPEDGPNGDSCDRWDLDYTLVLRRGRWLIDGAQGHGGGPAFQPC